MKNVSNCIDDSVWFRRSKQKTQNSAMVRILQSVAFALNIPLVVVRNEQKVTFIFDEIWQNFRIPINQMYFAFSKLNFGDDQVFSQKKNRCDHCYLRQSAPSAKEESEWHNATKRKSAEKKIRIIDLWLASCYGTHMCRGGFFAVVQNQSNKKKSNIKSWLWSNWKQLGANSINLHLN